MKRHEKHVLIEALGWYGVLAILLAYTLITLHLRDAQNSVSLFLNLTGSIAIAIDAYHDRNIQPVVLNVTWAVIALIGMAQAFVK